MAKQTKKAKRTKPRGQASPVVVLPAPVSPSQDDFKRARDLLRQRADALILDLAKRYSASGASELTTVLDAMDSLDELEKMQRTAAAPKK